MNPGTRLAARIAVAVGVAVLGWWAYEQGASPDVGRFNTALSTGVFAALVTVSLVGQWRRPTDRAPQRLFAAAVAITASYFRFLEPGWLAAIGAAVWFAGPALLLAAFTEPARTRVRVPTRRWNAALTAIGVAMVGVAGPTSATGAQDARRAVGWVWFDYRRDRMVRQPNPFAVLVADGAVVALSVVWLVAVVAVGFMILRRVDGRWWRVLGALAIADSILLAAPVRLTGGGSLLDGAAGDLLIAIPMGCAGVYAGYAVWAELIVPRLVRPQALVVQLDDSSTIEATRRRLARALGDPSARIVFATEHAWIDEFGHSVQVDRPDRRLVEVTQDGRPIAAIDLDSVTPVAPDLLADAAGSLVVSLEAQRLAALAEAAARDARDTAMRMIDVDREAIDQITGEIASGPERTLAGIDALLDVRPLPLDEIHDGLRAALEQVRSIAHRAVTPTEEPAEP